MNHSDMRKLRTTFVSSHLPSGFRGNTGAQSVALFSTRLPTKAERALCGFEFPPSQLPTSENRRHVRAFIYRGGTCSGRIKCKVVYCNNGYIYNIYVQSLYLPLILIMGAQQLNATLKSMHSFSWGLRMTGKKHGRLAGIWTSESTYLHLGSPFFQFSSHLHQMWKDLSIACLMAVLPPPPPPHTHT